MSTVPSIHFILPGGGPKGCFQAGFMHRMFTRYRSYFQLHQIDGTSVGALNGFMIASRQLRMLKEIWFEIKSISDIFTPWSKETSWSTIPYVGKLYTAYCAFHEKGCMTNRKMREILKGVDVESDNDLGKFQCVVTDLKHGVAQYVGTCRRNAGPCEVGIHQGTVKVKPEKIMHYVMASASPWILVTPVCIESRSYTDGALLAQYPIKDVESSPADLVVVVGHYKKAFSREGNDGNHILHFMARVVEVCWQHSDNVARMKKLIEQDRIILVAHDMSLDFLDFDMQNIRDGFKAGEREADRFFRSYLDQHRPSKPRSRSI